MEEFYHSLFCMKRTGPALDLDKARVLKVTVSSTMPKGKNKFTVLSRV